MATDQEKSNLTAKMKENLNELYKSDLANEAVRKRKSEKLHDFDINVAAVRREDAQKKKAARDRKIAELVQEIEEHKKNTMRNTLNQHNFQSYVIEMEPRFQRVCNLFEKIVGGMLKDYVAVPFVEWRTNVARGKVLSQKMENKDPLEVPDLEYFVDMEDDGELTVGFQHEFMKLFLFKCDENGMTEFDSKGEPIFDEEKAKAYQHIFQVSIEEWLNKQGYFVQKEGEQHRIYSQKLGVAKNGKWALSKDVVTDIYTPDSYDPNTYALKANPKIKNDKNSVHLSKEAFLELKENKANPEHSLGHFLEEKFSNDLTFRSTPRMGM